MRSRNGLRLAAATGGDRVEACPLLNAIRKRLAQFEFYWVDPGCVKTSWML